MDTGKMPFRATLQVAYETLKGLNTPRSLAVSILADAYLETTYNPEMFSESLESLGFRINWYDQFSIDAFRDDYQATVLFSKLPSPLGDDVQLRTTALQNFWDSEHESRLVNQSWGFDTDFPVAFTELDALGVPIERIRATIMQLVGRAPSLATLAGELSWSGGASYSLNRREASAETKAERGTSVTYPLARELDRLGITNPLISQRQAWTLVPGNLVDTVPKNITTDRTMAMSADINSLFQRAIGTRLARRLLKWGVNLHDQSQNQIYCARAHIDGSATVDLKNASNKVLLNPVLQSFPSDWGELLLLTREAYGTIATRMELREKGSSACEWFEYAMLSSMGNGFTFEVETTLFFALCLCAGAELYEICVYGDDIVIPQRCVPLLTSLLKVFGLEVNIAKSFTSGTFFESCGIYCFHGVDVTPFKIKDLLYGSKDCVILCNKIRMAAHASRYFNGCDKRYLPAWQVCLSRIRSAIRRECRGPVGSGLLLYVNRDEMRTCSYSRKRGRLLTKQLVPFLAIDQGDFPGLLPVRLRQLEITDTLTESASAYWFLSEEKLLNTTNRGNVVKRRVAGWHMSTLFIYGDTWYDLGRWW